MELIMQVSVLYSYSIIVTDTHANVGQESHYHKSLYVCIAIQLYIVYFNSFNYWQYYMMVACIVSPL